MQLKDFEFHLPAELIAKYPLAARSESKLMYVNRENRKHYQFKQVLQLIQPGDLIIFNNTKVIPARLYGKKSSGGKVEMMVERLLTEKTLRAFLRMSKTPHVNDVLFFADKYQFKIIGRHDHLYELQLLNDDLLLDVIEAIGEIPLPPYMHRAPEESDKSRYQTVYAKEKGSVAAPTAGFHFDELLLNQLREKNVEFAYLTLHIGAGTFAPVRVNDIHQHKMHAEYLQLDETVCQKIHAAKARGNRVIAVGTTSLRALETAYQQNELKPFAGETSIFIYPGYTFHSADVLITNLHLPSSTLMMLVCAFGGHHYLMQAYQEAIQQCYRFYSYGDAMWIEKN